ncbi:hypothetical protein [Sphingobium sp.]|uniref:hypothetical protein n=1 Tax=Sphingobium sp. TaxID=1912891 RepID=UPI003BB4FE07
MTGELRALGLAHGLLIGLLLAGPLLSPALMPWGLEALFIMGGFQLRLMDRRSTLRGRPGDWTSHIRMAPSRILPWAAVAIVTLIAGDAYRALAVLIAAAVGELLLYPVAMIVTGRLPHSTAKPLLILLLMLGGVVAGEIGRYMIAFAIGIAACLVWLRGPDGDFQRLGLALAAMATAMLCATMLPSSQSFAIPVSIVCATLALAHLSILRRRPVPWQATGSVMVRLRWLHSGSRPF